MERRLIVPNIGVKMKAFEAEGGLGQFKTLVPSNLNRSFERQEALKQNKSG